MSLPLFRSEQRAISEVTRKAIFDLQRLWASRYHGNMSELEFLGRLYDLDSLPSKDGRAEYNTCRKDIIQHTENNDDWPTGWVYTDDRFELAIGPDGVLLRFLAETLHPLVRPYRDAEELASAYNALLRMDGWQLLPVYEISGRPVYGPVPYASDGALVLGAARNIQEKLDSEYLGQQITRLQKALLDDPELAIGTAKEFLESVAKTVLKAKSQTYASGDSFPSLVKKALKMLDLVPDGLSERSKTNEALRGFIQSLGTCVDKLAEVRNLHGSGHGKDASPETGQVWLSEHHARLVVGSTIHIARFIVDCLEASGSRPLVVVPADAEFQSEGEDEFDPFADD